METSRQTSQELNERERKKIECIIIHDNVDTLVEFAKEIGEELAVKELSNAQFRNLFDSIKSIEMTGEFSKRALVLLKPRMAYATSRVSKGEKRDAMEKLKNILSFAIEKVENDSKKFERFVEFFEAILCYYNAKTKERGG